MRHFIFDCGLRIVIAHDWLVYNTDVPRPLFGWMNILGLTIMNWMAR